MKEITIEDVLKKKFLGLEDREGYGDSITYDLADQCAKIAMTEYASLNRQGWTRVEDGLPENRESVLCLDRVWKRQRQNSYEEHTDQNKEWFIKTYSHWMPLPTKPNDI